MALLVSQVWFFSRANNLIKKATLLHSPNQVSFLEIPSLTGEDLQLLGIQNWFGNYISVRACSMLSPPTTALMSTSGLTNMAHNKSRIVL